MRLNLLFLAGVAALSGTSALAWEHPVPTSQPLATDGTTEQYLYNVDAQAFLLGANDWETRASVSATLGFKWKVESTGSSTYAFIDYCLKFGQWRRMFTEGESSIWVDNNDGDNNASWTITRLSSGNNFQIGNEGVDGVLGTAKDITGDSRCYFYVGSAAATSATTWCSVSPDDYEAYLANLDRYKAAVALGELIAKTEEENPGIDLSAPKAVYNDETSTLEQINAAAEQVIAIAKKFLKDGTDITDFLKNPNMDQAGGWEGNPTINTGAKCAERYQGGDFDVYQEVTDVPVGIYEVTMQGFYREAAGDNAWKLFFEDTDDAQTAKEEHNILSYVYLNDGKEAMNSLFDHAVAAGDAASVYGSGYYTDPKGKYVYPNNMACAGVAFANNAYQTSTYGLVTREGDKLRLGVKGNLGGGSWAIFTNFKLTYRAKNVALLDELLAGFKAKFQSYDVIVGADETDAATALVQRMEDATDADAKFALLADCYEFAPTFDYSAEQFAKLNAAMSALMDAIEVSEASSATKNEAQELCTTIYYGYLGNTLQTADVADYLTQIQIMIDRLAVPEASDDKPGDCTALIKDADFTDIAVSGSNYGAWTFAMEGVQNGPKYGTTACEFWNGDPTTMKFEIAQTINSIPAGKYEVKAQAGNSYNSAGQPDNEGRVYLFAKVGDKETVPSVAVEPQDANANETAEYSVIFTVEEGDEVTLGFKSVGKLAARWFYCDTFTLTCYGSESVKEDTADNMNKSNPTGIDSVNAAARTSVMFNLNGQRVNNMAQPGLYIVNGKKMMVK